MYEKSKTRKVVVKLPKQMRAELTTYSDDEIQERGDYVYVSTQRVTKNIYDSYQIREAMIKGYVEMSQINLSIACECSHAEYEAEHTTERLVSGG